MCEDENNQDQQNDNQQFDGVAKHEHPTTLQGGQVDPSAYEDQSNTEEPDDQTQKGIVDSEAYTNTNEENPEEDSEDDTQT
jgi:hypothetical protein